MRNHKTNVRSGSTTTDFVGPQGESDVPSFVPRNMLPDRQFSLVYFSIGALLGKSLNLQKEQKAIIYNKSCLVILLA